MKVGKECIWVHTILKSKQDFLTPIAIPFFDENQAICPASAVLSLIQANNIHFGKTSSSLFLDWTSGSPLLTRNVAILIRNLFKELKLPREFGPYTIKHAVITYLTNHGVKMEEINDIAHFAKGSTILKNHYAISDPQRKIHSLIGNAISSEVNQISIPFIPSTTPFPLISSSLFIKNGISSEIVSNSSLPSSLSSIASPKVFNIIDMKENAYNECNNEHTYDNSINRVDQVNIDVRNDRSDDNNNNNSNYGTSFTNTLTNNNSSHLLESRKEVKLPRKVRSKQVDLLSSEYLTAKLNNERVINVKHPSLLPRSKPNRNPSQVSSSMSSNDEDSFLSDSDNNSKSDSSVFSSDTHVSEEKTDWVN
jgi:hypothetical protein